MQVRCIHRILITLWIEPCSSVVAVYNLTGLSSERFGDNGEEMEKCGNNRTWQDNDPGLREQYLQGVEGRWVDRI